MSKWTLILGIVVIALLAVFLYARYHKRPLDSAPVVPNTRLGPILPVRLSVGAKAAAIDQSNLVALGQAVQAYARKHGAVPTTLNALLQDPDHLVWLDWSRGKLPLDPVHNRSYMLISPARSGAEFEIDDNDGIDPAATRGYPGAPGNSFVFDSQVGIIVRTR